MFEALASVGAVLQSSCTAQEGQAGAALVALGVDDFEQSDFTGVGNVGAAAAAEVTVLDFHQAQMVHLRLFAQRQRSKLLGRRIADKDRMILADERIDLFLQHPHLLGRNFAVQVDGVALMSHVEADVVQSQFL